jgi:RNA polymerase sigma-70 factor, ECF subfamily
LRAATHCDPDALDDLVARAQAGSREAFREIVLALQEDVRLSLVSFEVGQGLIDEVVQSTFVTAYRKLSLYRPQGAFRAWLKTIAKNGMLKELREQKRFAQSRDDRLGEMLLDSRLEDLERAETLEMHARRLRRCLDALSPRIRELVRSRYEEQQGTATIAARLGKTETWVRVTLFRARKLLRRCMEQPQEVGA